MQDSLEPTRASRVADQWSGYLPLRAVSIIVPTYREVDNIPLLIDRVAALRDAHGLTLELVFMDDDSRDGSVEALAAAGRDWASIVVRTRDRGLSLAVCDGFRIAQYPALVCMDCDLSHPVEAIPEMLRLLAAGQKFVLGSRYVTGGSTDDDWGLGRWLNSVVATLLARPLTRLHDPMSGFFALWKEDFDAAPDINPVGYKIALELIVKCGFDSPAEIPIHFTDRQLGESKLTLKEQLKYIQHLRRLYLYRFANSVHLAQFFVVGLSGTVVNLLVLSLLNALGLPDLICIVGGIAVSTVTNFLLNRRFSFSYAKHGPILPQFARYLGATGVGLVVNMAVATALLGTLPPNNGYRLQLAALGGIAAGTIFSYLGTRYFAFRKRFVRRQ